MASRTPLDHPPDQIDTRGQKGTAKYKCPECGEKWKMKKSRGGPKNCEKCRKKGIQPYDFIPDENPKRMFGDFNCSCGRHWSSGYTWMEWDSEAKKWVDKWQQCRGCKEEVHPSNVRSLRYTGGNASQKPHDSEACEMCKEHGDCRNIRASGVEDGEWDDDDSASIMSEASSISDVSEDRDLSDGTPVNSDEEAIDDMLSSQLKGLHTK